MFEFLEKSIELANNHNYLDRLYRVYPIISNIRRNIDSILLNPFYEAYTAQDNEALVKTALKLDLFPIKDSYVAFLKRSPKAISLNPATIDRLSGEMYSLGWDRILLNITEPKEANRQMGSLFKNWLNKKELGLVPVNIETFIANSDNALLKASDVMLKQFAFEHFGYTRVKGLDFVARFNGQYVIGEAKFLTDNGGHQNAQFEDAINTLTTPLKGAHAIAILDGVLFIESQEKKHLLLKNELTEYKILSALLLKEYLYSL
jgi:hypothetical protein